MASASISFVLNRLGELAAKEAGLLRGVDDDIRLLRDKLEWLQTFIQHADHERRTGANNYIGLWVRQTRDVAYEVEDVLDEFLRKVDLERLGLLPTWKKWLKVAATCTKQVSVRHVLRDRMDSIKNRLKEISENVDKYKIEQLQPSASSSAQNPNNSAAASWYVVVLAMAPVISPPVPADPTASSRCSASSPAVIRPRYHLGLTAIPAASVSSAATTDLARE
ncbi:hypothetical protein HU200_052871 [Digitaria exilis]|uniref:Disease resistance N-terminal domain-containing protein n=1 Tax=Digitaria exilis TaxID=1010633 RepID=A0A835ATK3_9POAL|nr:hypothetical protein HU200_052871 [Digitaria exilis]